MRMSPLEACVTASLRAVPPPLTLIVRPCLNSTQSSYSRPRRFRIPRWSIRAGRDCHTSPPGNNPAPASQRAQALAEHEHAFRRCHRAVNTRSSDARDHHYQRITKRPPCSDSPVHNADVRRTVGLGRVLIQTQFRRQALPCRWRSCSRREVVTGQEVRVVLNIVSHRVPGVGNRVPAIDHGPFLNVDGLAGQNRLAVDDAEDVPPETLLLRRLCLRPVSRSSSRKVPATPEPELSTIRARRYRPRSRLGRCCRQVPRRRRRCRPSPIPRVRN